MQVVMVNWSALYLASLPFVFTIMSIVCMLIVTKVPGAADDDGLITFGIVATFLWPALLLLAAFIYFMINRDDKR